MAIRQGYDWAFSDVGIDGSISRHSYGRSYDYRDGRLTRPIFMVTRASVDGGRLDVETKVLNPVRIDTRQAEALAFEWVREQKAMTFVTVEEYEELMAYREDKRQRRLLEERRVRHEEDAIARMWRT